MPRSGLYQGLSVSALVVLVAALIDAPPARAGMDPELTSDFTDYSLPVPSAGLIVICHGFGCRYRTEVSLSDADRARLSRILAANSSAAAERKAVAQAVAWFDRRVGPIAGTSRHVARANAKYSGDPGQFDCIDASRNTTALLLVLEQLHLLRHHSVAPVVARGHLVDFQAPHATAVLVETATGASWAVDSWTRAAGVPAEILPLAQWEQMN